MNTQKKIEINHSSFLGLKAELLRKKNEVSCAKYAQQISNPQLNKKKLVTKLDKSNEGVQNRDKRDAEEIEEEANQLKKSQNALELKAKLYDKLTNNALGKDSKINTAGFLVDFEQKNSEVSVINNHNNEEEKSDYDDYSDDEEEWVDFVDCLGRTKRCHRDDLAAMKEQDEKLRISLHGNAERKETNSETKTLNELPQLCSEDMKKEILRQKWEEQERNLLDKKNVHYQDVLFDEARTHGVGYYGFSTDEAERIRQQEELKKLRKQTEERQAEAQTAAQRKQKQMEERLKAARRRKRERLGLPPEDEEEKTGEDEGINEEPEKKVEPLEELKRDVRKPAPMRPWDIGKEGGRSVMTQEEWIEKKRSERPEEFAPPKPVNFKNQKKKEERVKNIRREKSFKPEPVPIEEESEEPDNRGRGTEIPPPPTFDMFGPTFKTKRNFPKLNQSEIDKSIEEGLNFLRRQVEEKQARKRRADDEIEIL